MPGDVIIALKTAQHDLGEITPEGFFARGARNPTSGERNPVFLHSDSSLVELSKQAATKASFAAVTTAKGERQPKIVTGIIVTGDIFIASEQKKNELRKRFAADAVEMEGAAVSQVCYQQGVPLVVLRSLSDKADQNARPDTRRFYETASRNSAELVFQLVGLLKQF
ncbi:5'-methylthioadenosine/S-adenosylhomocysteine nucleosidase [candidate division CSSED10-310 bacterium]|uniref:5'-methylthioadenosine/S-adenosylhomocysteine nucleosidase n=1 Tax=candidate division CSSED10-310 bacterium TaxID=2855610 RepID=A0ABV6YSI2_UNCC1